MPGSGTVIADVTKITLVSLISRVPSLALVITELRSAIPDTTIVALLLPRRMSTSHPEASPPSSSVPSPPQDSSLPASPEASIEENHFLIRSVRQPDLSALSEVLASSFHSQEGWMTWIYPLLKTGIYEDLRSRLHTRGPHYACLVAVKSTPKSMTTPELVSRFAPLNLLGESTEGLVGTVEMSLKNPHILQPWSSKYLYLSNLAVQSEYRRQGVASQLLRTCERIALDWGFRNLYLHVLENNHRAKRLYWKAGYRLQRIEVNPLTLVLGQPRQLFLRKQL